MSRRVAVGLCSLLALASIGAWANDYPCDGFFGDETVAGNLVVYEGAECMLDGTTVYGNVIVYHGGALEAQAIYVHGNVEAYEAWYLVVGAGSWIDGNIKAERTTGTPSMDVPNSVCGTTVKGNVQLKENAAPFRIGCPDGMGNLVEGNVQLEDNYGHLVVEDNQIRQDLQLFGNHGEGSPAIHRNVVGGNLQCDENSPPPECSDNDVYGDAEGQCRRCEQPGDGDCRDRRLTRVELLGQKIFFDDKLSLNENQSCAECHGQVTGFNGDESVVNATGGVYEGSVPGRFGNRKPPTAAYAGDVPVLHYDGSAWIGGLFFDGRATGWTLGDPLAEQAQGPFLNPVEQALPDAAAVVNKVCGSTYGNLFREVWEPLVCHDVDQAYEAIARSVAAYERSFEVTAYTSKYDLYLMGGVELTPQEAWGLELFNAGGKGKCKSCHLSQVGPNGEPPIFTDNRYWNLGVPANPLNPFYYEYAFNPLGKDWVDEGLGAFLAASGEPPEVYEPEIGKVRTSTLRNLDLRPALLHDEAGRFVRAYGHNGYFKSIEEIVRFYNTRDALPRCEQGTPGEKVDCWPAPDVAQNLETSRMGNLGLSDEEVDAIVAFLLTLDDGYFDPCEMQPEYVGAPQRPVRTETAPPQVVSPREISR